MNESGQSGVPSNTLIDYHGTTGGFYKVWTINLLLTIITFGIYRAWAKSRMRRHIWSHLEIGGGTLRYTGTGGELFRGYVKVSLLFFLVSLLLGIFSYLVDKDNFKPNPEASKKEQAQATETCQQSEKVKENSNPQKALEQCVKREKNMLRQQRILENESGVVTAAGYIPTLLLFYLIAFARYSATRYRMTRTSWFGVRGRMMGSPNRYARLAFGRFILNVITLGYLIPKSDMVKQSYLVQDMFIGNAPVEFIANHQPLIKRNIITLLLAIPTLGFSRLWYVAALKNAKLQGIKFKQTTFSGSYSGGAILGLYLTNLLLLIITLGLAMPYILHRTVRFHTRHIHASGEMLSSDILQEKATAGNIGEGVEDELDTGLDLDFGPI